MENERERITNQDAISIPSDIVVAEYTILSHAVSAVLVEPDPVCGARLGTVRQLQAGTKVAVCGSGFTAKTVKVRGEDGRFYFVFAQDLPPALD